MAKKMKARGFLRPTGRGKGPDAEIRWTIHAGAKGTGRLVASCLYWDNERSYYAAERSMAQQLRAAGLSFDDVG